MMRAHNGGAPRPAKRRGTDASPGASDTRLRRRVFGFLSWHHGKLPGLQGILSYPLSASLLWLNCFFSLLSCLYIWDLARGPQGNLQQTEGFYFRSFHHHDFIIIIITSHYHQFHHHPQYLHHYTQLSIITSPSRAPPLPASEKYTSELCFNSKWCIKSELI